MEPKNRVWSQKNKRFEEKIYEPKKKRIKKYIPIFLSLFTKFRVLQVPELHKFCDENADAKRVYENVSDLRNMDLVINIGHRRKPIRAFCATPALIKKVLGNNKKKSHEVRADDLAHSLTCTKVAISLMRSSFVSGIALEHELGPNDLRYFCFERRPDGIIQITRDDLKYEIAVEVETSAKAKVRIDKILNSYQETFKNLKYSCAGVIIVATHPAVFKTYLRRIKSLPIEFQKRVILESNLEFKSLNTSYFGTRLSRALDNPHLPMQTMRTNCAGGVQYLPMKSLNAIFPDHV